MKIYKVEGYINGFNDLSDASLMELQEILGNNIDTDIMITMHETDQVELVSFEEDFEDSAFNFSNSTKEDLDREFDMFKEK